MESDSAPAASDHHLVRETSPVGFLARARRGSVSVTLRVVAGIVAEGWLETRTDFSGSLAGLDWDRLVQELRRQGFTVEVD